MSAHTHLFTDTHCHLYDPRSDEGTAGIVAAARAAGITFPAPLSDTQSQEKPLTERTLSHG